MRNAYQKIKSGDTVAFRGAPNAEGVKKLEYAEVTSKARYGALNVTIDGTPKVLYSADVFGIKRNGEWIN